jgi:uncharacterized protein (TIGR00730 family)
MNKICVFCGSSEGNQPAFKEAAEELAQILSEANLDLVYGGAAVGLMGILADQVLSRKGKVYGVIPANLFSKEIPHQGLTKLYTTETMHERKKIMYDLSDAFIALPGGLGTLDELCEVLTWAQMGLHQKPVGVLNVQGYFDPFMQFLDGARDSGLLPAKHRDLLLADTHAKGLVHKMLSHRPPQEPRWMDEENL